METIVLLKVAKIWATPDPTFLLPLALMIFGRSASPESSESDVLAPSPPGATSLFGALRFSALGALGSARAAGFDWGVVDSRCCCDAGDVMVAGSVAYVGVAVA